MGSKSKPFDKVLSGTFQVLEMCDDYIWKVLAALTQPSSVQLILMPMLFEYEKILAMSTRRHLFLTLSHPLWPLYGCESRSRAPRVWHLPGRDSLENRNYPQKMAAEH